jgi:alcohol dehydrogenase
LLKLVEEHKLDTTSFATHRFALGDMEEAYDTFGAAAETHALKVVLTAEPVPASPEHIDGSIFEPVGVS